MSTEAEGLMQFRRSTEAEWIQKYVFSQKTERYFIYVCDLCDLCDNYIYSHKSHKSHTHTYILGLFFLDSIFFNNIYICKSFFANYY